MRDAEGVVPAGIFTFEAKAAVNVSAGGTTTIEKLDSSSVVALLTYGGYAEIYFEELEEGIVPQAHQVLLYLGLEPEE